MNHIYIQKHSYIEFGDFLCFSRTVPRIALIRTRPFVIFSTRPFHELRPFADAEDGAGPDRATASAAGRPLRPTALDPWARPLLQRFGHAQPRGLSRLRAGRRRSFRGAFLINARRPAVQPPDHRRFGPRASRAGAIWGRSIGFASGRAGSPPQGEGLLFDVTFPDMSAHGEWFSKPEHAGAGHENRSLDSRVLALTAPRRL